MAAGLRPHEGEETQWHREALGMWRTRGTAGSEAREAYFRGLGAGFGVGSCWGQFGDVLGITLFLRVGMVLFWGQLGADRHIY